MITKGELKKMEAEISLKSLHPKHKIKKFMLEMKMLIIKPAMNLDKKISICHLHNLQPKKIQNLISQINKQEKCWNNQDPLNLIVKNMMIMKR